MAIDYTRNEIDLLIDLIREDNERKPLTTGQVTFGAPNNYTPTQGVNRNTSIIATAIAGRGYSGSQTFYYNRVALSRFVPEYPVDILDFETSEYTKLSQLLPELNERLKIKLTADKIVDATLPVFDDDSPTYIDVPLTVAPNSLCYTGTIILRVHPDWIPLSDVIISRDYDALIYAAPGN